MVSYKDLGEGEYVVLDLRTHVKTLFMPFIVGLLSLAILVLGLFFIPESWNSSQQNIAGWVVVLGALIIFVAWSVVPFLQWRFSRYVITNRRLITRSGIWKRIGRDIPLYRINDVTYEKDIIDRLFGCGTLVVSDATEKAGVMLYDIPRVERVQLQLHELLFAADDGSDDGEFPPTEPKRRPI